MITSTEAAKLMNISYQGFFRNYIKAGKLKTAKLEQYGNLKLWFVDEKEIKKLIKKRAKK